MVDAFRASADRLFNVALERVKELAVAYAEPAESPRPIEPRDACCGRHSLAARAARSVSDAAAGIASVLIVAEVERAEAERLVGAHRASVKDKDPLAPGTGSAGRSPNARPCRSATVFDFPSRLARGRARVDGGEVLG